MVVVLVAVISYMMGRSDDIFFDMECYNEEEHTITYICPMSIANLLVGILTIVFVLGIMPRHSAFCWSMSSPESAPASIRSFKMYKFTLRLAIFQAVFP